MGEGIQPLAKRFRQFFHYVPIHNSWDKTYLSFHDLFSYGHEKTAKPTMNALQNVRQRVNASEASALEFQLDRQTAYPDRWHGRVSREPFRDVCREAQVLSFYQLFPHNRRLLAGHLGGRSNRSADLV
jgi:hypothetical protein